MSSARHASRPKLTSPVRWAELILNLKAAGSDTWVEVGPKNVLTGLVRKILPQEKTGPGSIFLQTFFEDCRRDEDHRD